MIEESDLSRIGISLPQNLLERFDEIISIRGYSSRSEGIRDAIRSYILHYQWMADVKGERHGVITMVYDHDQRGLTDELLKIQHDYSYVIRASLHAHLSHDQCMEVILLHGEGTDLKNVAERLMSLKGVKSLKLTTISVQD